jgi:hypothetical protein
LTIVGYFLTITELRPRSKDYLVIWNLLEISIIYCTVCYNLLNKGIAPALVSRKVSQWYCLEFSALKKAALRGCYFCCLLYLKLLFESSRYPSLLDKLWESTICTIALETVPQPKLIIKLKDIALKTVLQPKLIINKTSEIPLELAIPVVLAALCEWHEIITQRQSNHLYASIKED